MTTHFPTESWATWAIGGRVSRCEATDERREVAEVAIFVV